MTADLVQAHLANGLACALPANSPLARRLRSERTWLGPGAKERLGILRRAKSVAVLGFSTKPSRASYFVGTYLVQSTAYTVHFVNPNAAGETVLGRRIHASLADLPEAPDIVDVFRKPTDLPGVVDEVAALASADGTPPVLWAQLGVWNEAAARDAEERGITVVMDRCLKIEHARFHGGLHLLGFDTGQITSRKTIR